MGQRGQALVETALAAPLLVLLTLGVLYVGQLCWLRIRLQSAAQAAARAYTVWQPEDGALALQKARAAAWLALRPQPSGADVQVEVLPWKPRAAHPEDHHATWLRGSLVHHLRVQLRLPPPPGLAWAWPQGLSLEAPASILSEESLERAKTL